MSRQKITAIVPVRKGSERIKNKNLKKFAGKNLLRIKLEMLKKIEIPTMDLSTILLRLWLIKYFLILSST